jgi:hypothetical protein
MMLDAPDPRDVVRLDGEPNLRLRMEGGIHGDVATVAAVVGAVVHRRPCSCRSSTCRGGGAGLV